MDLLKIALPFIVTALAAWAYLRRERQVDRRLGYERDAGTTVTDTTLRAPIKEALRRLPGVALMVAGLVLMQNSSGFAKAAMAVFVAWFAVEGFRSRVWQHKTRGADFRELRDLTLLFLALVGGLAFICWRAVASES